MNITPNINSLQTNQSLLNTTATSIENGSQNLTKDMTNLIVSENTSSVNVSAIKTQDEMFGSLLDIKA